jgi:predicted alpha/beta-hydrolase family hydrolase
MPTRPVQIEVPGQGRVSALLDLPSSARALYVMAHGSGAPMTHPFLASVSAKLGDHGLGTLRYQFPYMEHGRKVPDKEAVLVDTVRAAVGAAGVYGLPLLAGGKSLGGRMTSVAASDAPLPGVRGIVFLGFPLHSPAKPGSVRGNHLKLVTVPMLFLQGSRDKLARLDLLEPVIETLGPAGHLHVIAEGDHSFKVPRSASRDEDDVHAEIALATADWAREVLKIA